MWREKQVEDKKKTEAKPQRVDAEVEQQKKLKAEAAKTDKNK